jgi:hypothetical protein
MPVGHLDAPTQRFRVLDGCLDMLVGMSWPHFRISTRKLYLTFFKPSRESKIGKNFLFLALGAPLDSYMFSLNVADLLHWDYLA